MNLGLRDGFFEQGSHAEQLVQAGLNGENIRRQVMQTLQNGRAPTLLDISVRDAIEMPH